jgi:hypothetical protein
MGEPSESKRDTSSLSVEYPDKKRPRVEEGWNTSTVVPASRKRRQKGNTVSDEAVQYGWAVMT